MSYLSFPKSKRFDWRTVPREHGAHGALGVRRLRESLATENAVVGAATALFRVVHGGAIVARVRARAPTTAPDETVRF